MTRKMQLVGIGLPEIVPVGLECLSHDLCIRPLDELKAKYDEMVYAFKSQELKNIEENKSYLNVGSMSLSNKVKSDLTMSVTQATAPSPSSQMFGVNSAVSGQPAVKSINLVSYATGCIRAGWKRHGPIPTSGGLIRWVDSNRL